MRTILAITAIAILVSVVFFAAGAVISSEPMDWQTAAGQSFYFNGK
ncbi:MAG: hypothetical protein M0R49_01190 [Limnochordia bacterium]|nr:hypothetical protein [Limnochordia bacterium]